MRALLFIAIVGAGLMAPLGAADGEAEAQKRKKLMELAAQKQKAVIRSWPVKPPKGATVGTFGVGCFIDREGTAVMGLGPFLDPLEQGFVCGDQKLKRPQLLHVDPVYMIAVVKFDHQPEVWLELRKEPLASRKEWAAALTIRGNRPALAGPVWGRWKGEDTSMRQIRLITQMNLLAPRTTQPILVAFGCPVIDEQGRLCALFGRIPTDPTRRGYYISPSDQWAQSIDKARQNQEPLDYPLSGEQNPRDPAGDSPAYRTAVLAAQRGESELALAEIDKGLKRHPNSRLLKRTRMMIIRSGLNSDQLEDRKQEVLEIAKGLKPASEATVDEWILYWYHLGVGHRLAGDDDQATASLQRAVKLAPKGISFLHYELGVLHDRAGRREEALESWLKATESQPSNLTHLEILTHRLGEAGRWEEEDKFTNDTYEIERLTQLMSR